MSSSIDMQTLATFAILPGAAELMEAFATIPPGPMRDAVIHLAKTTAATYAVNGGAMAPSPIPQIGAPKAAAPAPLRIGREPPTDSLEMQAVKLRIEGVMPKDIAARTGLSLQQVYQATYAARKAGAPIPKRKTLTPEERPAKVWHVRFKDIGPSGQGQVRKAAMARGISVDAYMERRQLALKLAMEGAGYDRILEATGEQDIKVVSAWLSLARAAGIRVPYNIAVQDVTGRPDAAPETAQDAPQAPATSEPPSAPAEAPMGRVFPSARDMAPGPAVAIHKAAQRRGMSVAKYEDMRERIVILRRGAMAPSQISADTGQGKQFVKDTIDAAIARGVVFPPLAQDDGAAVFTPAERMTA